jgi:hypothetical protein
MVAKEVEGELEQGPILVTVRYIVLLEHREEFVDAMHQFGRTRRRDGASRWGVFHDTAESPGEGTGFHFVLANPFLTAAKHLPRAPIVMLLLKTTCIWYQG